MCLRSTRMVSTPSPAPPKIPEPRPPAPAPEETATAPILGKKRSSVISQQTPSKKRVEGAVSNRTGTAAVISRRRLGTSSLRIPLLTDLNTPL